MGGDRSNTRWLDDVSAEVIQRAARVQLAIFDVDGVLSDGKIYFSDEGRELKAFHARDGYGLKMLLKHGIQVAIITGRSSPIVAHRMTALGIDHVYQGREDKRAAYEHLIAALEIDAQTVACTGDDVMDLGIMSQVGLAVAVADAHPSVAENAHWHTNQRGGRGAAREVCDLLLHARGVLNSEIARFL